MIYLDNAATTMKKPQEVIDAVTAAMQSLGNAGRGVHEASMGAARQIYETRELLADFFHAEDASRIAFTANATESLNTAIKGILKPGDHVISTVMDHNSVLRPLYEMEKKGVEATFLDCGCREPILKEQDSDSEQIRQNPEKGTMKSVPDYNDFEAAIRSNTRAIVCTHASNLTGDLLDMGKIGDIARRHGLILIADASQTAGIFPIDVREMKIDILCFTGHKGLLGPQGTGGIYVRKGIEVAPLKSGGSGIRTFQKRHPREMPEALEAGTLNGHGIAGLGAGISYINRTGIEEIRKKEEKLMRIFYHGIKDVPGIRIYGTFYGVRPHGILRMNSGAWPDRCPIIAFNIGDLDSTVAADELYTGYGICVRAGGHCAPLMHKAMGTENQGAVRVSFSHFNTVEEAEFAVKAVKEIAEQTAV